MSERRRRQRLSPEARRAQLLDVTVELAAGGDIGLVSVRDIADRAGVSEGLLFHYFPTKQAIVAAAVTRAAEALLEDLRSGAVAGSPREQLDAALDAFLGHVRAQPTGWRAVLAARSGELAALAADVERQSQEWLLDSLGITAPTPVLLIALSGWAAFERDACLNWLDQPSVDVETVKQILAGTFMAALTAAAQHDDQAREALHRLAE